MNKLMILIERYLMPIAEKIEDNKYIQAVANAFISTLPITIAGSVFVLLANFPIQGYPEFLKSIGLYNILSIPSGGTLDLMSVFIVYLIAYNLAKEFDVDPVPAGMISLASYFIVTPQAIQVGEEIVKGTAVKYLGQQSLFVAIIIGLLVGKLYSVLMKKKLTITLPEGVPENISRSFEPIFVTVIIIAIVLGIHYLTTLTSYGNLPNLINQLLQAPLMYVGNSLGYWIGLYTLMHVGWFFGIHGSVFSSPLSPINNKMALENLEAFSNNLPMPNMFANWHNLLKVGGLGMTLGLVIFMAFFAKSQRYKKFGRVAILPGIFQINEPVVFGLPIVLNPIMFVPLVITPTINCLIIYFAMKTGLVGYARGLTIPWATPPFINAYLQGGFGFMMLQVVTFAVTTAIWIPFFMVIDKREYEKEQELLLNREEVLLSE